MPTLYMSDMEICSLYRRAEDQKAQIKILAELNSCDTAIIKDILIDNGLLEGVKSTGAYRTPQYAKKDAAPAPVLRAKNLIFPTQTRPAPSRRTAEEQDRDYGKYYKMGWSDRAIAAKLNLSVGAISGWRKRRGLPPNVGPGGKKLSEIKHPNKDKKGES